MKKYTLSIVIPIYNESRTVLTLLKNVYRHKIPGVTKELILVEDNSNDGTREIVKEFTKNKSDVKLILQVKARGKGSAVRRGLKEITGDIVLIQDADLEYDVNDYDTLIRPIIKGEASFVLGSRHLQQNGDIRWLIRRFKGKERYIAHFMNFGAIFFHTFFNLLYGTRLTDPTTMYKVFKSELLKKVHLRGEYFELDWEIVCKFVRLGYLPLEVPIKYVSRGYSEGKKVSFRRDVVRYLHMIIFTRFTPVNKL